MRKSLSVDVALEISLSNAYHIRINIFDACHDAGRLFTIPHRPSFIFTISSIHPLVFQPRQTEHNCFGELWTFLQQGITFSVYLILLKSQITAFQLPSHLPGDDCQSLSTIVMLFHTWVVRQFCNCVHRSPLIQISPNIINISTYPMLLNEEILAELAAHIRYTVKQVVRSFVKSLRMKNHYQNT